MYKYLESQGVTKVENLGGNAEISFRSGGCEPFGTPPPGTNCYITPLSRTVNYKGCNIRVTFTQKLCIGPQTPPVYTLDLYDFAYDLDLTMSECRALKINMATQSNTNFQPILDELNAIQSTVINTVELTQSTAVLIAFDLTCGNNSLLTTKSYASSCLIGCYPPPAPGTFPIAYFYECATTCCTRETAYCLNGENMPVPGTPVIDNGICVNSSFACPNNDTSFGGCSNRCPF